MANPEHVEILKQGAEAWNKWRKVYPEVVPDLAKAYLVGANLCHANLYGAKLSNADLSESKLLEVELSEADLTSANLSNSDLTRIFHEKEMANPFQAYKIRLNANSKKGIRRDRLYTHPTRFPRFQTS